MTDGGAQVGRRGLRLTIGGVLAAALLSIGLKDVVENLRDPVSALLVSFINFVLEKKQPQIYPLAVPWFRWSVHLEYVVTGLLVAALGLRVGFWLRRKRAE